MDAATITTIMPLLLAFAAGTMIYVVVEELIPEAHLGEKENIGTLGFVVGFLVMNGSRQNIGITCILCSEGKCHTHCHSFRNIMNRYCYDKHCRLFRQR